MNQSLITILADEIALLKALLEQLKLEKSALKVNALEQLSILANSKEQILINLEKLEQKRNNYFQDHKLEKKLPILLQSLKQSANKDIYFIEILSTFIQLSQQCAQQNLINGTVVTHNIYHLSRMMSIMHGHDPDNQVYDPQGKLYAVK